MTDAQRLEIFLCININKYIDDLMERQERGSTAILDISGYIEPTIDRWLEEAPKWEETKPDELPQHSGDTGL